MKKILHANDDNSTLSGAFIIAWRVERYLRKHNMSYDYLSMDEFDLSQNANFKIPSDDKTYSAKLRNNRLIGMIKLPFYVKRVLRQNKYDVIHIDADYTYKALFYAIPAKKLGVKTVVHSHTTSLAGDYQKLKMFCHLISKRMLSRYTDIYIGCSKEAAEWMIPKDRIKSESVLFNGIDLEYFQFNQDERDIWRKKLGLQDKFVIGNIGSLCDRKNQNFLIDILYDIKKKKNNAVLLLVGSGVDDYIEKMRKHATDLNLDGDVIFYGLTTNNTIQLLNAMDVFAFPSFVEGAPLAVYEAQATGLPCIMSNTISKDACINMWIETEAIDKGAEIWTNKLIEISSKYAHHRESRTVVNKYGIEEMANKLAGIYSDL